jgi:hypothetical protein
MIRGDKYVWASALHSLERLFSTLECYSKMQENIGAAKHQGLTPVIRRITVRGQPRQIGS